MGSEKKQAAKSNASVGDGYTRQTGPKTKRLVVGGNGKEMPGYLVGTS
jgi:hypothetical protein